MQAQSVSEYQGGRLLPDTRKSGALGGGGEGTLLLLLSSLLQIPFFSSQVKREILVEVLTKRKTVTVNDKLILPYSLSEVRGCPV